MFRREKKFYSDAFKERLITAYQSSNESVSTIAQRYGVNRDTFHSWVYHRGKKKSATLATSNLVSMQKEALSPEAMLARIRALEGELSIEKMRSESLSKMIEIAERELQIDIRKKTGARQSMR